MFEIDWNQSLAGAWPLIRAAIGMLIVAAVFIGAFLTMPNGVPKKVIAYISPFVVVGVFLYLLMQI
ncbi:hypothetical protein [Paenibacillus shenyangensis]|uniref:hypothetical protein n=1 Tax=Paenibacillus sp. A9 TaxID=1284352 RepID=UPI0003712841|nr:hypothetical protein [Paenibacillus sp. A9]